MGYTLRGQFSPLRLCDFARNNNISQRRKVCPREVYYGFNSFLFFHAFCKLPSKLNKFLHLFFCRAKFVFVRFLYDFQF